MNTYHIKLKKSKKKVKYYIKEGGSHEYNLEKIVQPTFISIFKCIIEYENQD